MAIQHRDITGNNIHEPKGVDTAPEGLVYVSSGSGSGAWTQIGSKAIKGLPSTNPIANQVITTDGTGGFQLGSTPLYGSFTHSYPSIITLTTSPQTIPGSPSYGALGGMSIAGKGLRVSLSGVYKITANMASFISISGSPNNRTVTFRLRINGTTLSVASSRTWFVGEAAPNWGIDTYLTLNANDYVEPVIYVNTTGTYTRLTNTNVTYTSQLLR